MSTTYTIWPLRFSAQPAAMIEFFATLGLQQRVGHDCGTWGVFAGRSGTLGVHDLAAAESKARSGQTGFNLTVADVAAAADELRTAGLDVRVWDETYGKQGLVEGADGWSIGLNEAEQDDLYGGYIAYPDAEGDQTTAASMDVLAICFTSAVPAGVDFLAAFGFAPDGPVHPAWTLLRGAATSGFIGLHEPVEGSRDQRWELSFATSEPLDALAARLTAAGHPATVVTDEAGPHVDVVDPDGVRIEIHLSS